jgi:hypothetical protein
MRHLLMDPAFPNVVEQWAAASVDDRARVWTITRGRNGRLDERLDPDFLKDLEAAESLDEFAEAILTYAAVLDVEQSRVW